MVNKIETVYLRGSNKGFSLRFCMDFRIQHRTLEEGRKTYQPKLCEYNNKDEVNSLNILSIHLVSYNHKAAVVLILLYGCTTWTLTKRLEKKLDSNYTRMLRAILNKSWWQHPTRHQIYGHLSPITKTIQARRTRHMGHSWRSRDELISDVFLWTPTYGLAKTGQPAQIYIQHLCEYMGCDPEDLPEAMINREKRRERVKDIHESGTSGWWWWWYNHV